MTRGYWRDNEDAEMTNGLRICGCYNPTLGYKAVHEVLKLVNGKDDPEVFEKWLEFLEDPFKAYTVYVLNELRPEYNDKKYDTYLEHGGSICGSWLSETGKRLLKIMDEGWDEETQSYDFEDTDTIIYQEKYLEFVPD